MKSLQTLLIGVVLFAYAENAAFVWAEEWASPIDKKYELRNTGLYAHYSKAHDFLDNWRGQQDYIDEAGRLLSTVIKEDPGFAPAHREFGRLLVMAGYINYGNYSKRHLLLAERAILKSIEIEPAYADAYVLLGHLYTNMKKYDGAKAALRKAELIGTQTPWLDLYWADVLMRTGEEEPAAQRYMRVFDSKTSNKKAYAAALNGVERYYAKKGEYSKADEWYKKILEYEPESAWNWGNYSSFLLFRMNDVDGAIVNAERALAIMDYGMGRFALACALYTKWALVTDEGKDSAQAKKLFDRAYAVFPDLKEVINKTKRYKFTENVAEKLEPYLKTMSPGRQSLPEMSDDDQQK